MTVFIFDLDGTITSKETLPLIARHFDVESQIDELTRKTIQGNIPFVESFIMRVNILGKLPVSEIADLLEKIVLYQKICKFVQTHQVNCIVATGNLDCWIDKLAKKLGCIFYNSEAEVENNRVIKIRKILRKENIVDHYHQKGQRVVYIGDGNNDAEAMRKADIAIACGLTHMPAISVLSIADYLVFEEVALCRLLNQLL